MNMLKKAKFAALFLTAALVWQANAEAGIIKVSQSAFTASAGLITFSEKAIGTTNPTYAAADYGGGVSAPTVTFDGFFTGQALGTTGTCPAGTTVSGCVVNSASNPLTLDSAAPDTFIVNDGSNPHTPVLSGSPLFNGAIAILFSSDQYGVGIDGGIFDNIGGTAITAFARDGSILGSFTNTMVGIEFLGLVTDNNLPLIAGIQLSLVGPELGGFAIDNLRFGGVNQVSLNVPEPSSIALIAICLAVLGFNRKRSAFLVTHQNC